MKHKQLTVEQALGKLESAVTSIQDEGIDLEQSLATFEAGIKLIRETQEALAQAEQKVSELTGEQVAQASTDPNLDQA